MSDPTTDLAEADTAVAADGNSVAAPPLFSLRVSEDKMQVLLDCPDPLADPTATATRIIEECVALGLPEYPDQEFLQQVLPNICTLGEHLVDTVLIMGEEPVPPRHGRLDWSRDYFATGWAEDARTGAVDFWARLDNHAVAEGEILVTVHPAAAGEAGLNVFGAKLPVDKPAKVRLRCGKGVTETALADGVLQLTAAISGRVRFADNTLAVDNLYIIKGNVNLETGNVVHTGTLQIEGDVTTGASIEAEGDIIIKGILEPAMVRAGGSLIVGGGIVGSPETSITVGGALHAKYIREAVIRAGGDVNVVNEVSYADIETRGRVDASRGRIAGGRTIARKGIVVGEAGASGSSQTLLAAGVDPLLARQAAEHAQQHKQMVQLRDMLQQAIAANTPAPGDTDESRANVVAGLKRKVELLATALAEGDKNIARLAAEARHEASEEIFMLRECWAGTTVQLGEDRMLVRASVMKPRLVKRYGNRIRVVPMGPDNLPTDAN
jgi:hypothetical protein